VDAVTVFLVDDHEVLRLGVREFVASEPGYEVVGEARTARDAFEAIDSLSPDVVVMDIDLPGMDGVLATREILRRLPRTRVLVLSAHDQIHDVIDALNAGALGYARKADPHEAFMEALQRVAQGLRYLSPAVAARVSAAQTSPHADHVLDVLSEREREIFRLAADCRTSAEIARQLCLARKTVDTHLNRIHRKLGLHQRAELVRLAVSLGLVHSIRSALPGPDVTERDDG
jgi:two-component system, NarL family, response regulator LiaR